MSLRITRILSPSAITAALLSAAALLCTNNAAAQVDTVAISDIFTTHLLFPTDIIYADLSNKRDIDGIVVEASKDVIALQAKRPFTATCNVTAMESSGTIRTYILRYDAHPRSLVVDEKHEIYNAPPDTVVLSKSYTSHMVYSSDLTYAHLSSGEIVDAMVLPQAKNILAITAKARFNQEAGNVTVLESDGFLHTYITNYEEHPRELIHNYQRGARGEESGQKQVVSLTRQTNAPQLSEVLSLPQGLFHIATRKNRISVICENVFSYSDITYVTLRLENHSGISFEADRTNFVIRSRPRHKTSIVEETNLIPKATLGSLSVASGQTGRMVFSFDKLSLAQDHIFRICVYESGGRRDFFLDLSPKDINEAPVPFVN